MIIIVHMAFDSHAHCFCVTLYTLLLRCLNLGSLQLCRPQECEPQLRRQPIPIRLFLTLSKPHADFETCKGAQSKQDWISESSFHAGEEHKN